MLLWCHKYPQVEHVHIEPDQLPSSYELSRLHECFHVSIVERVRPGDVQQASVTMIDSLSEPSQDANSNNEAGVMLVDQSISSPKEARLLLRWKSCFTWQLVHGRICRS